MFHLDLIPESQIVFCNHLAFVEMNYIVQPFESLASVKGDVHAFFDGVCICALNITRIEVDLRNTVSNNSFYFRFCVNEQHLQCPLITNYIVGI